MPTDLVLFDPVFARFQTTGVPVLHRPLDQAVLDTVFVADVSHDVNWRFYDPAQVHLDDLEGLDYYDQARLREPDLVTPDFLDAYELEHIAQTGHAPRARWYRDTRARHRRDAHLARQATLTRAWARGLEHGTFTMPDHDEHLCSGTEEWSDFSLAPTKLRAKRVTTASGRSLSLLTAFSAEGALLPMAEHVRSRQTADRYRDRSVAETAIFHPVPGDGLTLDEMLSDMRRFGHVVEADGAPVDRADPTSPEPEPDKPLDQNYLPRDLAKAEIRKARRFIEHAEQRAAAIEICRFPWSDDQAHSYPERARGWVRRSRLLSWGTDTWQVILTRKLYWHQASGEKPDVSDPANTNHWTVFVRTHTGSETVKRKGRPDLQVWTWEPHYWLSFADEETATQWLERLEDAFMRETQLDLDAQRWPQDLTNDRSEAARAAAAQWKIWQRRDREGWSITSLDTVPGQIEFNPNEALSYDPVVLQQTVDSEYLDYLNSAPPE